MTDATLHPPRAAPADPDLAAQALPGHGVPSQHPSPAAQVPLTPAEAEREAKSVVAGGGMVGGLGRPQTPATAPAIGGWPVTAEASASRTSRLRATTRTRSPTICSAARRSPCASSRHSMRRWPARTPSPPPTSVQNADGIVPFEGSELRTHPAVPHSQPVRVKSAPHGLNAPQPPAFSDALLTFLRD